MTLPPALTTFLRTLRGLGYGDRPAPHRDWAVLLVILLLLLAVSTAWNVWFFFDTVEGEPVAPAAAVVEEDAGIAPARASYELRAVEEANYRSEYRFVDPSK